MNRSPLYLSIIYHNQSIAREHGSRGCSHMRKNDSKTRELERRKAEKEEIERKRAEYYEVHMRSETKRLKDWVDFYEFKLDKIRKALVNNRL